MDETRRWGELTLAERVRRPVWRIDPGEFGPEQLVRAIEVISTRGRFGRPKA